jgi:hypothetical protein
LTAFGPQDTRIRQKLAVWEPSRAHNYKAIDECCRQCYMLCCLLYLNPTFCTQKTAQIRAVCVFCRREDVALRKTCMLYDQYKQPLQTGVPHSNAALCVHKATNTCLPDRVREVLLLSGAPPRHGAAPLLQVLHCRCCDFQFFTAKKRSLSKTDINKDGSFPFRNVLKFRVLATTYFYFFLEGR